MQEFTVVDGCQNLASTKTIELASEEERKLGDWTVEVSSTEVAGLDDELHTSGRLDGTLQDIWLVCDYDAAPL